MKNFSLLICFATSLIARALADNEIQVYASPITQKGITFAELHTNTNYTFKGIKNITRQ